uniref:Chromosome 3 open reading frame 20 n=1 Tax=Pseudonaja textilis TaxID=8673 RepID=A0A670XZG6_PSETE
CCYIKDEMNELQMKAKAPKLLADMVHMLITWQRMGFHVPRGVRNIFEFTWDELIEIAPRKSFTGLYCPVAKFLPYEEAELASATTSRTQKVGATHSMRRTNYVTSLEGQPMLMKFQKRSIHLLTELLKLKMKIMIDAVAGLLKIKGGGSSTGQDKESILSDKFDPCPEAREKKCIISTTPVAFTYCSLLEMLQLYNNLVAKLAQYAPSMKQYLVTSTQPIRAGSYPSGNIAVFQFPICCIGKTITFLFQDVPTQGFLGMFSPGHSCLSYSFKSSFSVALLINQQGGVVRDKYGQLTHHWNWYSRKEVLQSLDFQINENLKLKVLSQNSMTITFAALNESLTLSLIRPGCLHGCKADKQLKYIEADKKEHWRRILIDIKRRFQKTTKQFINSVLMISGIVIMLAKEEIPDGSPTLEPWAIYPMDCPIVLRKVLTKTNEGLGCKCVVKIPLITDLEFEKFITAPRDPQQVIVICVLSPQKHSYSPFFEWSVEQVYIKMQHGRPSPCIQSKHDSYRFLKYDLENPLNKTPPLLVQKHGVVPGMVVMYAGGKLLFGSCVFNGYSYSKKDLLKQINQVCLDCKRGHFLPQKFNLKTYSNCYFLHNLIYNFVKSSSQTDFLNHMTQKQCSYTWFKVPLVLL